MLAKALGAGDVGAYLIGSIGPLLGAVVIWVRARTFSGASAAIFAFTALSALVAVIGSTDSRVLLYKDCATTAVIGLVFGLSCVVLPRPVMFYFAQRYGTDGTKEGMAAYDQMWVAYRGFRTSMYQISIVWAVVFLAQAAITDGDRRLHDLFGRLHLGPDPPDRGPRDRHGLDRARQPSRPTRRPGSSERRGGPRLSADSWR